MRLLSLFKVSTSARTEGQKDDTCTPAFLTHSAIKNVYIVVRLN